MRDMNERTVRPGASSEAGFSVIEGLIAALILLVVVLGVLPLVSQSMVNNAQGNSASNETNASIDKLESLYSLPFNNAELTVPAGQTSLVEREALSDNVWIDAALYSGTPQYVRQKTVEQFSAADLDDDGTFDTALDGSTLPNFVHLKRIRMQIEARRVFSQATYDVLAVHTF
jgi:Tfp pilus assembly protein PilV